MPDPIAQFRVFPGKGVSRFRERSLHWEVLLYATHRQMDKGYDDIAKEFTVATPHDKPAHACVLTIIERRSRKLGYVFLCAKKLDADTLTHEAFHMARSYVERRHGEPVGYLSAEKEETLAWATGNCAAQLVKGLWRRRTK